MKRDTWWVEGTTIEEKKEDFKACQQALNHALEVVDRLDKEHKGIKKTLKKAAIKAIKKAIDEL